MLRTQGFGELLSQQLDEEDPPELSEQKMTARKLLKTVSKAVFLIRMI
jgi:hypothetical protein